MDDLSAFADDSIDLVLALGVFQMAESLDEWARTLDETARVLAPGGQLLVATFAPGTEPRGVPLEDMVNLPGTAVIKDGYLVPGDAPGFGIEVDLAWLEQAAV